MLLAAVERSFFPSIIEFRCFAFFTFTLTFPSQQESSNHNLNSLIIVALAASKFNVESGGSYGINNEIARHLMIINVNQLQGNEFAASKFSFAEDHVASTMKLHVIE